MAGRRASACASCPTATASPVDPRACVEDIGVGTQQRAEILKALYRDARVLILDEPTAVLTPQESAELLDVLRELRARGTSIIIITHKLDEVLQVADRDQRAAPRQEGRHDRRGGRDRARPGRADGRPRRCCSEVERGAGASGRAGARGRRPARARRPRASRPCAGSRCAVRAGEIVGIAGVDGNGQTELVEAIAGMRKVDVGQRSRCGDRDITDASPRAAAEAGIGAHPAGPPAPRPRARLQPGREQRAARLPARRRSSRLGWLDPTRDDRARAAA